MKVLINNHKFDLTYANSFKKRLLGLMGQKNIKIGVLFPHCNSIHTFFMKEEIDVLMINKNLEIKKIYSSLKRNKIIYKKKINIIIELPKKTIEKYNIKVNDKIKIIE